jgi:predicted metalloendopeptidase
MLNRWRLCLHTLNLFVPDAVGAVYLRRVRADLAGADVPRVRGMLRELRRRLGRRIAGAGWMEPARCCSSSVREQTPGGGV